MHVFFTFLNFFFSLQKINSCFLSFLSHTFFNKGFNLYIILKMLFTHIRNFVHKIPKMTKNFRSFPHTIAPGCIKIVVVCYKFIFIKTRTYQLPYLALEIFFECLVIPKVSIFFCVCGAFGCFQPP